MPTQKNSTTGTEREKSQDTSRQGGNLDRERERSSDMGHQGGQQQQKTPGSGQQSPGSNRR
jgi:general stress protein YciG